MITSIRRGDLPLEKTGESTGETLIGVCLVFSVDFGLCLLDQLFWFTFSGVKPLFNPQRIRSDLCVSEFSSFHGWLDWRDSRPDSRANWRRLPVHHSRHPLSGTDYSQTVAPFPVGARVFPCS